MSILHVIILAIVQGLAELLPISSSAHVVVTEKLMGLDPSSPEMTLLLVMLHTGTMFAVIVYFWKHWKETYFSSADAFKRFAIRVIWATAITGVIGEVLKKIIEKTMFKGAEGGDRTAVQCKLDSNCSSTGGGGGGADLDRGFCAKRAAAEDSPEFITTLTRTDGSVTMAQAGWMGVVQGLALPFRGFSRSGSTISTGILVGAAKEKAERFSFALAVVLTPAVVGLEGLRLLKAKEAAGTGTPIDLHASMVTSLLGMVCSFGGIGGVEVAEQLARAWTVVHVRDLLHAGFRSGFLSSLRPGTLERAALRWV